MSSSDESPGTRYKKHWPKKKPYTQKYRKSWEQNPEFSAWLTSGKKGNMYFHCKVCGDEYLGGISAVRKHSGSEKHKKKSQAVSNIPPVDKIFVHHNSLEFKKKEAEIRLAMFITEHNISLRTSDHLVQMFKSIFPESEVVKTMSCNRTKATALVSQVIGKNAFENLIFRMKNQYFSILIDESTDKSSIKHLALVVRIIDLPKFVVKDEFCYLKEMAQATANDIYSEIINFFNNNSIPYKDNLIGFASDGASTMFGVRHSVKTLLENEIPHIFVMKCMCHSLALCASYAAEKLPNYVEDFIREVYTYMHQSFKRQSEFKNFQSFVESKPHKLLQPSQTRWLSLHSCVKRVLEQFNALKLYFQGELLIDQKANQIFEKISNPCTELYLQFLDFVLPILTTLNILFQSQSPQIHLAYDRMAASYKSILECYLKPEYIQNVDISLVQYRNPSHFLTHNEIYLGGSCTLALSDGNKFPTSAKNEFITNCLNFYVECTSQIYKRFPFNSAHMQLLKTLSFIEPKNIKTIVSITTAAKHCPKLNINMNDIDREWRLLRNSNIDFNLDLMDFCKIIKTGKYGDDKEKYPLINRLVSYILTLPHSSACVERLFSTININKTKLRNRLSTDTITGILHSKNILNNQQKSCYNFNISSDMIGKHTSTMYNNM